MRIPPFLTGWSLPELQDHEGQFVTLTPLVPERDAPSLFRASHATDDATKLWSYLAVGPFENEARFQGYLLSLLGRTDLLPFTVRHKGQADALGMISIMRIVPQDGVAELGSIWYTPHAQRTAVNTETIYLLLRYLFEELEYRRIEWKCDSANLRSAAAAHRLGFTLEGCFRQHMVIKGRNRDTLWFSLLDREWPEKKGHFERVLYSGEKVSLSALNAHPQ